MRPLPLQLAPSAVTGKGQTREGGADAGKIGLAVPVERWETPHGELALGGKFRQGPLEVCWLSGLRDEVLEGGIVECH